IAADAGLGDAFIAWLTTSNVQAASRIDGGAGWVNMRGETVALSADDLLHGNVYSPIEYDEHGAFRSTPVATGTAADAVFGAPSLQTCGDVRDPQRGVTVGHSTGGAATWTDVGLLPCTTPLPIYCLELPADAVPPAAPVYSGGLLAFATLDAVEGD